MKRGYIAGDREGAAERRKRTAQLPGEPSRAQQQFKNEVDVNVIVRRFGVTGHILTSGIQGVYGDFAGIEDFEGAAAKVQDARTRFYRLPPDIREHFENDPAQLIRFVQTAKPKEMREVFGSAAGVPEEKPSPEQPPAA